MAISHHQNCEALAQRAKQKRATMLLIRAVRRPPQIGSQLRSYSATGGSLGWSLRNLRHYLVYLLGFCRERDIGDPKPKN